MHGVTSVEFRQTGGVGLVHRQRLSADINAVSAGPTLSVCGRKISQSWGLLLAIEHPLRSSQDLQAAAKKRPAAATVSSISAAVCAALTKPASYKAGA
jgi:hypothetical protein